jgi:3-hydroxybutyrate dehydrogenase
MRSAAAITGMMDELKAWGGLDVLVNNTGVQRTASLADMTQEIWDEVVAVNLSGVFHTMRRALPAMAERGYGRVINIASVHGLVASADKAAYVSAKFGLVGLTRVAALEYAAAGSRGTGEITFARGGRKRRSSSRRSRAAIPVDGGWTSQ